MKLYKPIDQSLSKINLYPLIIFTVIFTGLSLKVSAAKLVFIPLLLLIYVYQIYYLIPLLFIFSCIGTQVNILIFLCSLAYSTLHFRKLGKFKFLFLIYLAIFGFFIHELVVTRDALRTSIHWSYYFSFSIFFWTYTIRDRISGFDWKYIRISLYVVYILQFLPVLNTFVWRVNEIMDTYFIAILLLARVMKTKVSKIDIFFGFLHIFLILIKHHELKLHGILAVLISSVLFIYFRNFQNRSIVSKIAASKYTFTLIYVYVTYVAIVYVDDLGFSIQKGSLNYYDLGAFFKNVQYKFFSDRGVVWRGVYDRVMELNLYFPPIGGPIEYNTTSVTDALIEDINFGAHNIPLEMVRNYGIIVGLILSVILIYILLDAVNKMRFDKLNEINLLIFCCAISVSLTHFFLGQAILQLNYSIILFGLLGLLSYK